MPAGARDRGPIPTTVGFLQEGHHQGKSHEGGAVMSDSVGEGRLGHMPREEDT